MKSLPFSRVAAGGGRQHPQPLHLHGVAQRAESLERIERLLHRVGGSRPLVCTSRPRPASVFSLNSGVGLRVTPS